MQDESQLPQPLQDPMEGVLTKLGYDRSQLAMTPAELTVESKAYAGPLFNGIFAKFPGLEHVFTTFPEGEIIDGIMDVGKHSKEAIIKRLAEKHMVTPTAEAMISSDFFTVNEQVEPIRLIRMRVDQFFPDGKGHDFWDIVRAAEDLGLELCPAEVGPLYQIAKELEMYHGLNIGMNAIRPPAPFDGRRSIFRLYNGEEKNIDYWPYEEWEFQPHEEFVFCTRNSPKI